MSEMKMKRCIAAVAILASVTCLSASAQEIIPRPLEVKRTDGTFTLSGTTPIRVGDGQLRPSADFLVGILTPHVGELPLEGKGETGIIFANAKDEKLGEEGYRITITPHRIVIQANTDAGAFYAVQTLRQLLPPASFASQGDGSASYTLPCLEIRDIPRFSWRGGHFDVGRHFMPVEFVKKYVDALALHKFNRMHWHLTEDQGWRIEIKKYPKLTEIGSKRKETIVPHSKDQYDGTPHSGFYTQEEIKEIVAYAAERHVTIVPEIEFPGHCLGAIAAYPELGCLVDENGKPVQHEVWGRWGVSKNICNPSDETITFFKEVFKEVAELFPGPYFHIGGDEAPLDQWKTNPVAQAKMEKYGFNDVHQLQSLVLNDLVDYLGTLGKRSVGWSDILHKDLARETVIMPYHGSGEHGTRRAIENGHEIVMTPTLPTYFDYAAGNDGDPAIGHANPIQNVYAWDPLLPSVPKDKEHLIIGSQFHCWTEYMPTPRVVEKRVYPRACAMAEVLWSTPENRNFTDFQRRLAGHNQRLIAYGLRISAIELPAATWSPTDARTSYTRQRWDVSQQMPENGRYEVEFKYTRGTHGLDVRNVVLMAGGKTLDTDAHEGFAGGSSNGNIFELEITHRTSVPLVLQAEIKGRDGADSHGKILIRRK